MQTYPVQIFNSYYEFLNREDQNVNGISPDFINQSLEPQFNRGCYNCNDCYNCNNCNNCNYCNNCNNCNDCNYCNNCNNCNYCNSCKYCNDCNNCNYCNSCKYCNDCNNCNDCNDFNNFKTNPQRYVTPFIGSRKAQTTFCWTETNNLIVICGCFKGNLKEFITKVNTTYPESDTTNIHGIAYRKEIKKIKFLLEIE